MVKDGAFPLFRVVEASWQSWQVWFRTAQCDPSKETMEQLHEDLFLRSSGAFSLGLEDLQIGLIEVRLNPTYLPSEVDMRPEEVIEEVKATLCMTASGHPSFDPSKTAH